MTTWWWPCKSGETYEYMIFIVFCYQTQWLIQIWQSQWD